jgi:pimeloyl-ACP methyl ester carboxylesterase
MGAKSSKPSVIVDDVDTYEFTVDNDDGYSIPCKLWTPSPSSRNIRAAALYLHGGMFSKGDRNSHSAVTRALVTECGLAVLTANFRDGSTTKYSSGQTLSDLKRLTLYLKTKFPKLPFGIIGSSSGGYFALQLCNAIDEFGDVQFCIPLAPVAHPHARAIYLKHCLDGTTPMTNGKDLYSVRHTKEKAQTILDHQLAYFQTFKQMSQAAEAVSTNLNQIPTLLVLGAVDKNVPSTVTQQVQQHWATRTIVIGGVGHEFQNEPPSDPIQNYIPDIDRFLKSVLKEEEPLQKQRPWCS